MDFERDFGGLPGGSNAQLNASIFLFASAEFFKFFLEHFFADVALFNEGGVGAFGGTGAFDKFRNATNFFFLERDFLFFGGFFFGVLTTKVAVIPFVNLHFVSRFVDEESFIGDGIEKLGVVGNDEDGAMIVAKEVGDEFFGGNVEVVSRLVEEKETGIFKKDASESDFGLLAAGEVAHFTIGKVAKLHFLKNFEEFVIEVSNVVGIDEVLENSDALENFLAGGIFGEFFIFEVELSLKFVDGTTSSDIFPDGDVLVLVGDSDDLGEVANAETRESNFAVVERFLVGGIKLEASGDEVIFGGFAEDDFEKSGLPRSVHANYADFVISFEVKISVIIDDFCAVGEMKMGGFHERYYIISWRKRKASRAGYFSLWGKCVKIVGEMENFRIYKGKFQASRPHENDFFREFAGELNNAFDQMKMRGALYDHPKVKSDPECLPDNILLTKHAVVIIDFKDVGGEIELPDAEHWRDGHWQSSRGFEIKGGGEANPFMQLEKQRKRLRRALKDIRGLDLTWNPIVTGVICHGKGAKIVGEVPGKYHDRFFVTTGKDYLGKILDFINVQSRSVNLDEESGRELHERFDVERFKDYREADRKQISELRAEISG